MLSILYPDGTSNKISFSSLLESKQYTVLYFYPKDDTSGCTLEAKTFSDYKESFDNMDCHIIGVSHDSIVSHTKFCNKYQLKIPLISDEDLDLHEDDRFKVWKEKSMYGKKYMGTERSTFLLDRKGIVIKERRKVSVSGHIEEVLAFVQDLH